MFTLYDYQEKALENILKAYREGYKAPILVAPCAAGKTVIFSEIARRALIKGNRVIIIVHRAELLRQTVKTLDEFNIKCGLITSGKPMQQNYKIQVASIQSLVLRLDKVTRPTLIIFDECHHAVASTYIKVINYFSGVKLLGVTATPCRTSGEGLNKVFDKMIIGATAEELMVAGRICRPVYYAPPQVANLENLKIVAGDYDKKEAEKRVNKPTVTGDAIAHYKKICPNSRAVAFCVSRKHADSVAQQFREAGIPSQSIDGTLKEFERRQRIADLECGKIKVLTSCELISEGLDVPIVDTSIMLRPTQSLAVWIQQAGRALRKSEGKTHATILDHVGNIFKHGAVEQINDWSLEGIKRKKNPEADNPIRMRRCKKCFIVIPVHKMKCEECGTDVEITERELKYKEAELQQIELEKLKVEKRREVGQARSYAALLQIEKERGYKSGWAYMVYKNRAKKGA